jgi:hypothetical protein
MGAAEQQFQLQAGEHVITYSLGFSPRAKRVQLRVGAEGIQVRLPVGTTPAIGHGFVEANADWVVRQLARLAQRAPEPKRAPLRQPLQETLKLAGRTIPYTIKPSSRARRARVVVGANGVELIVPARADLDAARAFLRAQANWVLRQMDKRDRITSAQTPLPDNVALWRGAAHPVRLIYADSASHVRLIDDALIIVGRDAGAAQIALTRWLQKQAATALTDAVAQHSASMGVRPARIALRDQQTRWGSCSTRKTISFNWRLIHAPPGVLDYVVVHELAHLTEFNHSRRFWELVETHCPDYRGHAAWLKSNGWRLRQTPRISAPLS